MEAVQKVIDSYPGVFEVLDGNKKVRCILTKHEFPCTEDALSSYIKGKKFQRIYSKMKAPEKYAFKVDTKYKEFFVPSKKSKTKVLCRLTKKEINNVPHEIEQHIAGYRFKKSYFYFKEGSLKLDTEQPDEAVEENENQVMKSDAEEEDDEIPPYALSENSDIEDDEEIDSDEAVGEDDEIEKLLKSNTDKTKEQLIEEKAVEKDLVAMKDEKTVVKPKGKKRKSVDSAKPVPKLSKKAKKKKKENIVKS